MPKIPKNIGTPYRESGCFRHNRKKDVLILDSEHYLAALPMFYKKVLHQSLQEAVLGALETPIEDQLCLLEELAIIRALAADSLGNYSNLCEEYGRRLEEGNIQKIEISRRLKEHYSEEVIKQLKLVAAFCEKAANVNASGKDKFSIHTVNSIIAQTTRILFDVCEKSGNRKIAEEFNEQIKTKLRVPRISSNEGTDLLPSDDVLEMDATIPKSDNGIIDVE